jgi:hypothetical protein
MLSLAVLCCAVPQIVDSGGSTVVEMSSRGECTGHAGSFLGRFEGMTFQHMKVGGGAWCDAVCVVSCYIEVVWD